MISWSRVSLPKKDCLCLVWLEKGELYSVPVIAEYDKHACMFFEGGIGLNKDFIKAWSEIQEPEEWRLPK